VEPSGLPHKIRAFCLKSGCNRQLQELIITAKNTGAIFNELLFSALECKP
jgi:hypothetical protein